MQQRLKIFERGDPLPNYALERTSRGRREVLSVSGNENRRPRTGAQRGRWAA